MTFKNIIKIILSTGGKSLNNELLEYFSFDLKLPTASAFIQQRDKISHNAFQLIFNNFNKNSLNSNKFKGYRLFSIDGSKITISHNPNDNKTFFLNKRGKGHNSLHLNAAYDLCNRIYTDVSIQNGREQ